MCAMKRRSVPTSGAFFLWPGWSRDPVPMFVQQRGTCSCGPAAVLSQQRASGRGGAVYSVCIFQGGKLIFPHNLKHNKAPAERQKIKTVRAWSDTVSVVPKLTADHHLSQCQGPLLLNCQNKWSPCLLGVPKPHFENHWLILFNIE